MSNYCVIFVILTDLESSLPDTRTAVPYNPPSGVYTTIVAACILKNTPVRLQCITTMSEYKNWSLEVGYWWYFYTYINI